MKMYNNAQFCMVMYSDKWNVFYQLVEIQYLGL